MAMKVKMEFDMSFLMTKEGMKKFFLEVFKEDIEIAEKKAKEIYLSKRIKAYNNKVISSFLSEVKTGSSGVVGYLYVGGKKAPHAIYLEEDHRLRNGMMWSQVNSNAPYKFMAGGAGEGIRNINNIICKKLNVYGKKFVKFKF